MKKIISIMMVVVSLLCVGLTGCTAKQETKQYTTDLYTINVCGDSCYILIDEEKWNEKQENSLMQDCEVAVYPEFTTMKEMRQAIITGSFTEREQEQLMKIMKLAERNADGGIEIFNVDKLNECVLPSGMNVEYILWMARSYYFHVSGPGKITGGFYCVNKEVFDNDMNTQYRSFLVNEYLTVTAQEFDEEREATVYYTANGSGGKSKYCCYEILEGTKRIVVEESYLLESATERGKGKESDMVPDQVTIWIEDEVGYAFALLFGFEERPSVEWLSQFGLREYVETEVA